MDWPFGTLQMFGYDVIVADPPWYFELRGKSSNKAAASKYDLMPLAEIKALPVGSLARAHTLLFLWACSPMMPEALDVMRAWGFQYKTMLAWRKTTASGKVRMGCGYVARTMHEPILVGAIGTGNQDRALPSAFDGLAREHSRKPDVFYDLIRAATPRAFRCDLFSRETREGFSGWGNEARKFDDERIQPGPHRTIPTRSGRSRRGADPGAAGESSLRSGPGTEGWLDAC